ATGHRDAEHWWHVDTAVIELPSRRRSKRCNCLYEHAPSHRLRPRPGLRRIGRDYSRDLLLAKWDSGVSLHGNNPGRLMSALGQKQTLCIAWPMSALPPIADILGHEAVRPQNSSAGVARNPLANL